MNNSSDYREMIKKPNEYHNTLKERFKDLEINLVKHDTSFHGLPCYIEVVLGHNPKDKGNLVLDLGNYLYSVLGLKYQMTPEFRGRGKKTTVRWFCSWENIAPIQANICSAFGTKLVEYHLPFEFQSLIIQNASRGVYPTTISIRS